RARTRTRARGGCRGGTPPAHLRTAHRSGRHDRPAGSRAGAGRHRRLQRTVRRPPPRDLRPPVVHRRCAAPAPSATTAAEGPRPVTGSRSPERGKTGTARRSPPRSHPPQQVTDVRRSRRLLTLPLGSMTARSRKGHGLPTHRRPDAGFLTGPSIRKAGRGSASLPPGPRRAPAPDVHGGRPPPPPTSG